MYDYMAIFFNSFWSLLNDLSVYILFGLLFAGVLKQFIPEEFVKKQLGEDRPSSILKSALFGIPLPLCSCSVLPFASSLRKEGASKSATQTFLISTPITGADSIFATWGIFGIAFTIYRVLSSIVISLIAGFLTLIFDNKNAKFTTFKPDDFNLIKVAKKEDTCSCSVTKNKKENFFKRVYDYAFKTLLSDIAKPLLIGLVIAAMITTFLPNTLPPYIAHSRVLSYLAMLLISLPMYVCATASIPLGVSFLLAGFSPGAVFIFLTAGPASNAVTIAIVKKLLGSRSLLIYLSSIIIGSLVFAYFLDFYFFDSIKQLVSTNFADDEFGQLSVLSSILLMGLCFNVLKRR